MSSFDDDYGDGLAAIRATLVDVCDAIDRLERVTRSLSSADVSGRALRHALAERVGRIERLVTLQHREHYDANGVGDVAPEDESREMTALLAMIGGEG